MEVIFEVLFGFFGELIVQVLFEGVAQAGFRTLAAPFQNQRPPWLSAIGHVIWGLIAGGISLLVFPNSFLRNETLRLANVAVTPLVAGFCMMQIGRWRASKDDETVALDRFGYGFLFALAMAAVRYFGTR